MVAKVKYKEDDGTITCFIYDPSKTLYPHNPYMVISDYREGEEVEYEIEVKPLVRRKVTESKEKPLPKSKQLYLNPATGKMVGYVRAKNLGLV